MLRTLQLILTAVIVKNVKMPFVHPKSAGMSYADIYLFLYNVVQGIGWSGVLLGTGLAAAQGAPLQACFLIGAGPASKLGALLLLPDRPSAVTTPD